MKLLSSVALTALVLIFGTSPVFAATSSPEVSNFTSNTLSVLILFGTLAATIFLIKGGYQYISSTGKPDSLENAKKTIKNSVLGLLLVLAAATISSLLQNAFNASTASSVSNTFSLTPITPATPSNGLTQVIIDAIVGFLQNIIESSTKPLLNGIIGFLSSTPSLVANSVVFNFWLVILGITDSLFALVIALLGFHLMSADSFGFDEIELKHILPRIGLAFLGANISIFLADWVINLCNVLVQAVLSSTGGLTHAWVLNAFDPAILSTGATPLITLIFMILYIILAVVLLLMYISRLILVSLGAVLSPIIFLLWTLPKFASFAEISIKSYLVTVFTIFTHVVLIQLASSFLTLPGQQGTSSLISILVAIGLFFTLLKTPHIMLQFVLYSTGSGAVRKIGGQIINVIHSSSHLESNGTNGAAVEGTKQLARRVIQA